LFIYDDDDVDDDVDVDDDGSDPNVLKFYL
jgi:hypothetical protein